MRIYDAFTFFNETDLLKLRCDEIGDSIEQFVIVEGDKTFTGNPKPFYLDKFLREEPREIVQKITRLKYPIQHDDAWENEIRQRNAISWYFDDLQNWNDIIIISDVDEIPNIDTVLNLDVKDLPVRLDVRQFFWNFNWEVPQHCNNGARPVVATVAQLVRTTAQNLRADGDLPLVPDGGWHFSFLNEEDRIAKKIESFAHTEYNSIRFKDLDKIRWRIENGIDPFDRFPLKWTEIDETFPKTVRQLVS